MMDGPAYQRIAAELRENIKDGIYQVGQQIPTEDTLAGRFSVNRHTLRRAVGVLAAEGLVRVDHGRGMFVAAALVRYPIGQRVRFNESLKAQGIRPHYALLGAEETTAFGAVARHLQVPQEEPIVRMDRLGLADGSPLKISTSYFPLGPFPKLLQHIEHSESISRVFKEIYGCDHIRKSTTVTARMVRREDARLLSLPLNQPILMVESINVDQHGQIIEYGITRFRSDQTEVFFEFTGQAVDSYPDAAVD